MEQKLLETARQTKYPLGALNFVRQGLDFTIQQVHGQSNESESGKSQHIGGRQLCMGLLNYAIKEYGLLARTVLQHWGINNCEDFGRIVFALVDADLMIKTEEDSLGDFTDVYDFKDAFSTALTISNNV